ncbi:MAG: hypothetical protein H0U97_00850 [Gammaproteobacteria bacterium]|nr:hypothetical protein [Gammaproteobacteria bacterium]
MITRGFGYRNSPSIAWFRLIQNVTQTGCDILSQLAIMDMHLYYADMEARCVTTDTTHPEPSMELPPPAGGAVGAVVP